jgi:hypothetical protein
MKNFIFVKENVLDEKECEDIIKYCSDKTNPSDFDYLNYDCYDFDNSHYLFKKILPILQEYKNTYPEIDKTASIWDLTSLRFKSFEPGKGYTGWHSEHCLSKPDRVLNVQIYLSNHRCGTEFYNGDVIMSKVGKLAIFPSYFTHTHRGQICPDNKPRYIITGYVTFMKKGPEED